MNDNSLKDCIVILVLGRRDLAEALCAQVARPKTNVAQIALQGKGVPALREAVHAGLHENKRAFLVSGFPESSSEAEALAKMFLKTTVFSFSKERIRVGKQPSVHPPCATRIALDALGVKATIVDKTRSLSSQASFVEKSLPRLFQGFEIQAVA